MSDFEINPSRNPSPIDPPARSAPAFSAVNQPSYVRTLFLGPDGLRPGWGFTFYVVTFYVLQRFAVELAWAHKLGAGGLWSSLLEEFGDLFAAIIPAIVLARIEPRPWKLFGLPLKQTFGRFFWIGLFWGFAAISLLMFVLYGLHCFAFGHVVLRGMRLARFAVFWWTFFFIVGLFEEFFLRGYLQFTLTRGIGFWPAAITLSCVFGLFHLRNGGEQWRGILAAVVIGLFFCLTLRRTGNLWFAVGFHAAWDWGESFFYSVPDSGMVSPGHLLSSSPRGPEWLSGGSVGPEGSVLCFAVIALAWISFDRIFRRAEPIVSDA
jgi:uncharacterized protein